MHKIQATVSQGVHLVGNAMQGVQLQVAINVSQGVHPLPNAMQGQPLPVGIVNQVVWLPQIVYLVACPRRTGVRTAVQLPVDAILVELPPAIDARPAVLPEVDARMAVLHLVDVSQVGRASTRITFYFEIMSQNLRFFWK
jgi:hypothetical protein